jgi:predicted patatin/cPLA2 family phospholipase
MCQRGDLLQMDFKNITRRYMLQIQRNVRKGNIKNVDWIYLTTQNVTYVD